VGATPFWLAARFNEPGGACCRNTAPMFVHHGENTRRIRCNNSSAEPVTTALMAGPVLAAAEPRGSRLIPEREALMLERSSSPRARRRQCRQHRRRTALDAAKVLSYCDSRVEKGSPRGKTRKENIK
jgi:hypothetical protein